MCCRLGGYEAVCQLRKPFGMLFRVDKDVEHSWKYTVPKYIVAPPHTLDSVNEII